MYSNTSVKLLKYLSLYLYYAGVVLSGGRGPYTHMRASAGSCRRYDENRAEIASSGARYYGTRSPFYISEFQLRDCAYICIQLYVY